MTPTSLSRDVNPEASERRQASVLGQHLVECLVAGPRSGLRLGGVDQLGGDLRTGSVKELTVGDGGTVHVIDVPDRKLRGALGASRSPDGNGGDGDYGIHRERLAVGCDGLNGAVAKLDLEVAIGAIDVNAGVASSSRWGSNTIN